MHNPTRHDTRAPWPVMAAHPPRAVLAAQILFSLNAMFWVVMGAGVLARYAARAGGLSRFGWLISAGLMFATAAVLFVLGLAIRSQRRRTYLLAVACLTTILLLTITDEFGLPDLIALLGHLALLLLLVATRSHYRT